jgi:hypothetical protein
MKVSKEELRSKIRGVISQVRSGERLYPAEKEHLANAIAEEIHQQDHPIFDHPWYYPGREYLGIIDEVVQENFPGLTTCLSDNADAKVVKWELLDKNGFSISMQSIYYGDIEPDQVNSIMHKWRVEIMRCIIGAGVAKIIDDRRGACPPASVSVPKTPLADIRVGRVEFLLSNLLGVDMRGGSIETYKKRTQIKELAEILIK